jgi:hypothetical protein
VTVEPAAGICGGKASIEAYVRFMGVESLEELEEEQLCLFPLRKLYERPPPDRLRGRRAA